MVMNSTVLFVQDIIIHTKESHYKGLRIAWGKNRIFVWKDITLFLKDSSKIPICSTNTWHENKL